MSRDRSLPACRLYMITPPRIEDPPAFAKLLEGVLDAGDVATLQIRLKDLDDEALARAVGFIRPVAQRRGVAVILNDRPDLAFELSCDGVHVGQEDASYKDARQAVGPDAIVGVTCHSSRHLAMEAAESGADYVAFGAFFPTATKEAKTRAPIEIVEWWSGLMTVPSVVIGGITVGNCRPLIEAGADFLAVSAGIWNHPAGPAEAVRAFNAIFAES